MSNCPYCNGRMRGRGRYAPTRDHINPRKRGGGPTITVCQSCNVFKADKSVLEWLQWIETNRPSSHRRVILRYAQSGVVFRVPRSERVDLLNYIARFI